jgi:uncharacterized SAM-binding protein YcdF (DUF218 family)
MIRIVYDAVIVLSGGLTREGVPQPWVQARLDAAVPYISESTYVILNSRGTPHKPPPLSDSGHPIDECHASAEYLTKTHGVRDEMILLDAWSYDTMGNAFFALVNHVLPREFSSVLVVTSEFHMTRTRVVFEHIFGLARDASGESLVTRVDFVEAPNTGMTREVVEARVEKELKSLRQYEADNVPRIGSLKQLNVFMFSEHGAYSYANGHKLKPPPMVGYDKVKESY